MLRGESHCVNMADLNLRIQESKLSIEVLANLRLLTPLARPDARMLPRVTQALENCVGRIAISSAISDTVIKILARRLGSAPVNASSLIAPMATSEISLVLK